VKKGNRMTNLAVAKELQATLQAINRSCMFCPEKRAASQVIVYEPSGGLAAYLCFDHLGKFFENWADPAKREFTIVRLD
jgi:hypothetical protein